MQVWYMNGGTGRVGADNISPNPDGSWKPVGVNFFDADAHPDILFSQASSGHLQVWFMNGPNLLSSQGLASTADSNDVVVGTNDFNNDLIPIFSGSTYSRGGFGSGT